MAIRKNFMFLLLAGLACSPVYAQTKDKAARPEMMLIPQGEFVMGSNRQENTALEKDANALNPYGFKDRIYVDEHPAHKVNLPAFWMDTYEVTNAQYKRFVAATGHQPPATWVMNGYNLTYQFLSKLPDSFLREVASNRFNLDMDVTKMRRDRILSELLKAQKSQDELPVTAVSWFDASDYCSWAGKRLPTEAEWEKAARGPNGYEFPWGNDWDPKKINTMSENPDAPYTAVGSYPGDVSGYGVYDMAANVTEWVDDWYDAYPGATETDNKLYGKVERVSRGGMTSSGHYDSISLMFRNAKRYHWEPGTANKDMGFRCAKDAKK